MQSYFIWTVSGVSGIVRSNFIFHTWIISGMLSEPVLWYSQRGILNLHFKSLRKTYTVLSESYTAYILLAICFNLQFLHLTMESLCYQKLQSIKHVPIFIVYSSPPVSNSVLTTRIIRQIIRATTLSLIQFHRYRALHMFPGSPFTFITDH